MKIEICECSAWSFTVTAIVLGIIAGGLIGCDMCERTNREAIKAGLEQKQVLGTQQIIWSKP